jgi:hypothetical protein
VWCISVTGFAVASGERGSRRTYVLSVAHSTRIPSSKRISSTEDRMVRLTIACPREAKVVAKRPA